MAHQQISHAELLELKRWNTPTIFNGWEQITSRNIAVEGINLEAARFMDTNENTTLIPAARSAAGRSTAATLDAIDTALETFSSNVKDKFGRSGEYQGGGE